MGFRGEEFAFQSPSEAVDALIARLQLPPSPPGEPNLVPLDRAVGRILAQSICIDRDSPAFDHSAMDGYALRFADLADHAATSPTGLPSPLPLSASASTIRLSVVGESRIGNQPPAMPSPGIPAAIRIVTGAGLPAGSDCIVKREDVTEYAEAGNPVRSGAGAGVAAISITPSVLARLRPGDNIRRRGENAREGDVVLGRGSTINAACIGLLAAIGATSIVATPRVRVAIITTGDELVPPGQSPSPFQIRNSNAPALHAILAAKNWLEVAGVVHVRDEGPALEEHLHSAAASADAIVLTGGVSMGHRDPVRAAVESLGARIIFHGLPQRPGKPMLGAVAPRHLDTGSRASARGELPIFALPGNPISAMVTCTRIVLPVLAAMAGAKRLPPAISPRLVTISNPDGKSLELWWHRLAALEPDGSARLLPALGSGDIVAGGRSDGFVELPPGARPDTKILVPFFPWAGG